MTAKGHITLQKYCFYVSWQNLDLNFQPCRLQNSNKTNRRFGKIYRRFGECPNAVLVACKIRLIQILLTYHKGVDMCVGIALLRPAAFVKKFFARRVLGIVFRPYFESLSVFVVQLNHTFIKLIYGIVETISADFIDKVFLCFLVFKQA